MQKISGTFLHLISSQTEMKRFGAKTTTMYFVVEQKILAIREEVTLMRANRSQELPFISNGYNKQFKNPHF